MHNSQFSYIRDIRNERLDGTEKVNRLKDEYGLKLTREVESEVSSMCSYATAMENKGIEKGLKALVKSLKDYIGDFDTLYKAVIKNEEYSKVSREQVMKYYKSCYKRKDI